MYSIKCFTAGVYLFALTLWVSHGNWNRLDIKILSFIFTKLSDLGTGLEL